MQICEECGERLEPCPNCGKGLCGSCSPDCEACTTPEDIRREVEKLFALTLNQLLNPDRNCPVAQTIINNMRKNGGHFLNETNEEVIARLAPYRAPRPVMAPEGILAAMKAEKVSR